MMELYWDLENVSAASSVDVASLVARLRQLRPSVSRVSGIVCGKLASFTQTFVDAAVACNLQVAVAPSGKNAADHILERAIRASRVENRCVVLLSGDGGFATVMSELTDTILVHTNNNVADTLLRCVSEHYAIGDLMHERTLETLRESVLQTHASEQNSVLPFVALHVAALYRCGRVGAGKLAPSRHSFVSPEALARAHREHHGVSVCMRPRMYCQLAARWLQELVLKEGTLQLYIPTEALFEQLDGDQVRAYVSDMGWRLLDAWDATPVDRRVGHPVWTRALMCASPDDAGSDLDRILHAQSARLDHPYGHPELNVYLYAQSTVAQCAK